MTLAERLQTHRYKQARKTIGKIIRRVPGSTDAEKAVALDQAAAAARIMAHIQLLWGPDATKTGTDRAMLLTGKAATYQAVADHYAGCVTYARPIGMDDLLCDLRSASTGLLLARVLNRMALHLEGDPLLTVLALDAENAEFTPIAA